LSGSSPLAAWLMALQLARWLRGIPVEADVILNLLAGELTSASNATPDLALLAMDA
jgi:hypothetical protein